MKTNYIIPNVVFELFLSRERNSSLPSSATCKRLFSTAGLIYTIERSLLSNSNFDKFTFMILN